MARCRTTRTTVRLKVTPLHLVTPENITPIYSFETARSAECIESPRGVFNLGVTSVTSVTS